MLPGIDASFSRIDRGTFKKFYGLGYRIFVQDLWLGGMGTPPSNNTALRAVAESNLMDAEAEGFTICGYINASPWYSADVSLDYARTNAGSAWNKLFMVALDVEIVGLTTDHVRAHLNYLKSLVPVTCIYTANWFWTGHLGNPTEFSAEPLWNAFYDDDPDFDFSRFPYGGWTEDKLIGEQYGGTSINGVEVDLNSFKEDFFMSISSLEQKLSAIESMLKRSGIEMASLADVNLLEAIQGNQRAIKALIQSSQLPPDILKEWI